MELAYNGTMDGKNYNWNIKRTPARTKETMNLTWAPDCDYVITEYDGIDAQSYECDGSRSMATLQDKIIGSGGWNLEIFLEFPLGWMDGFDRVNMNPTLQYDVNEKFKF